MKTILIPFHEPSVLNLALDAATPICHRFNSFIQVLLVREAIPLDFGPGVVIPPAYLTEVTHEWRRVADSARGDFLESAHRHQITIGTFDAHADRPVAEWHEVEGPEEVIIAQHARLFDMVIVGRPAGTLDSRWTALCEASLFESGRPALLAPPGLAGHIGDRVLIAWNGSPETARTIAFAMPFLSSATAVTVLGVNGWQQTGPAPERMAAFLRKHGIAATDKTVDTEGRSPGEAIVDEVLAMGADLLVKGAYTRSRLRQIIFGGATQHIVHASPVATFMAH